MPELPDLTVYCEALAVRVVGRRLVSFRPLDPFVLRTVSPTPTDVAALTTVGVERMGKRVVIALEDETFIAVHLMIAGRFKWKDGAPPAKPAGLAMWEFSSGALLLTEAGSTRRAAIHLVRGRDALSALDRGGMEVMSSDAASFGARLRTESHTLKRALTDPRLFSGIGNAYSDEILHRARLSPVMLTGRLTDEDIERLHAATIETLSEWTARLREQTGTGFPEKVTAFRTEMAVHGKYRQPCPDCGTPVQRIRYAANETNYCARCQTDGRLLADRALSRLLGKDWPRSIDEVD